MTDFKLDTSGAVEGVPPCGSAMVRYHGHVEWGYLSPFTQGYIEAALKDPRDLDCLTDLPAGDGPPRRGPYWIAFSDLAPETLARIIADCEAYEERHDDELHDDEFWSDGAHDRKWAGGEMWKSRQAGKEPAFPPLTVQLGDDGNVHFREGAAS